MINHLRVESTNSKSKKPFNNLQLIIDLYRSRNVTKAQRSDEFIHALFDNEVLRKVLSDRIEDILVMRQSTR